MRLWLALCTLDACPKCTDTGKLRRPSNWHKRVSCRNYVDLNPRSVDVTVLSPLASASQDVAALTSLKSVSAALSSGSVSAEPSQRSAWRAQVVEWLYDLQRRLAVWPHALRCLQRAITLHVRPSCAPAICTIFVDYPSVCLRTSPYDNAVDVFFCIPCAPLKQWVLASALSPFIVISKMVEHSPQRICDNGCI